MALNEAITSAPASSARSSIDRRVTRTISMMPPQSNSTRASALPDIPTVAEAGYPNSEYNFWAGVFVPAKTPAPIKEKLYAEIAKALAAPSVRDKLKNLGADPLPLSSAQFDAQVRKEIETNSKIAKAANIKVE